MYWKDKYRKAIRNNTQLIGDKILRKYLFEYFPNLPYLEEVRFPEYVADVLFINPKKRYIIGIEVKSDRDDLDRLENQLKGYLKYCNFVYVATTVMHKYEVRRILNKSEFECVGLLIYYMEYGKRYFELDIGSDAEFNKLEHIGMKWVTKHSQLHQWLYLLEIIWGSDEEINLYQ